MEQVSREERCHEDLGEFMVPMSRVTMVEQGQRVFMPSPKPLKPGGHSWCHVGLFSQQERV